MIKYDVGQVGIEVNRSHMNRLRVLKMTMENWDYNDGQKYSRGDDTRSRFIYFLVNKLHNVRHPISVEQATNGLAPSQDHYSYWKPTLTSAQAKVLAEQLGLTNR